MYIIPVIDIKNGCVVLAHQGQREQYLPLNTPLCASSHIEKVIASYLTLYPFKQFYLADLDALMSKGHNNTLIKYLFKKHPTLHFIVDSGGIQADLQPYHPHHYTPIIGTESLSWQTLSTLTPKFILSLDFDKNNQAIGDKRIHNNPRYWPQTLIIMTLAHVGNNNGIALQLLKNYQQRYPDKTFIAAGGVRHNQDLIALTSIGIQHVLVASALHKGTLKL